MRRDYLYVAALVLGLFAFKGCYDKSQQALGAERALSERLLVERGRWQQRADSLARAYRVDTVRLTRYRDRWRTLTDTLNLTDTLVLTETVTVTREVLVTADATIRQCTLALGTCEARIQAADSLLARADSLVWLWQRRAHPSLFAQIRDKAPIAALFYFLGRFTP